MKTITVKLKASHFDDLQGFINGDDDQYKDATGCPIFRAVKEQNIDIRNGITCGGFYLTNGDLYNSPDNHIQGVRDMANALANGAKECLITFTEE